MRDDEDFERRVQATREDILRDWEPPKEAHCSNCAHALCGGAPDEPRVRCERGHGKASMPLWTLIRKTRPQQFVPARDCRDYESMSDDAVATTGRT